MDQRTFFLHQNLAQLEQGVVLLRSITDEIYAFCNHQYFESGVGKHVRHILDHYDCYTRSKSGKVDYDSRLRDPKLEVDREYAITRFEELRRKLSETESEEDRPLQIRCNEGPEAEQDIDESESSDTRELQYLASHTIHHYALIAMILKILGAVPPKEFGVAPSTLEYLKRQQRAS
jgi:uncharacterized damage-inducible protein DinB